MQALLNIVGTELHKSFSPLFNPALSEDTKAVFRGRIRERLTWFDQQLSGKDYLLGQFSMADPYLFVVSNWAKPMAVDLNDLDNLLEFRKRMSERPTIQAAMAAEGLKK
jgi:glutathione S-transferase